MNCNLDGDALVLASLGSETDPYNNAFAGILDVMPMKLLQEIFSPKRHEASKQRRLIQGSFHPAQCGSHL